DGIRDFHVTGVQTCALPIYWYTILAFSMLESAFSVSCLMVFLTDSGNSCVPFIRLLFIHKPKSSQLVLMPFTPSISNSVKAVFKIGIKVLNSGLKASHSTAGILSAR